MKTEPNDGAIRVSTVVVAYNSAARIGKSISSIEATMQAIGGETVVVDNASTDLTALVAESHLSCDRSRVIRSERNLGFGGGANLGIRTAIGRYILVLCDHARVPAASLERLIEVMESDPGIGAASPVLHDDHGQIYYTGRIAFPGPEEEWHRIRRFLRLSNKQIVSGAVEEIAWLQGASILFRAELVRRIGGFNEAFFMFGEDADLGKRLREYGYRSVVVRDAIAHHPADEEPDDPQIRTRKIFLRAKSRSIFYRIWYQRPLRSFLYLSRAIGLTNQPSRLTRFLPLAFYDGRALHHLRFPDPLSDE